LNYKIREAKMNRRKFWFVGGVLALALILVGGIWSAKADSPLTPMEELGKQLFFDEALSINGTQSCATCHAPEVGFVGPVSEINAAGAVYPGAAQPRQRGHPLRPMAAKAQ
jgi:cytochrome c peroxidase